MTAIALKDGIMAADSSSWHGPIMVGHAASKIYRIPEIGLAGFSGWKPIIFRAVEWLEGGAGHMNRPTPTEDGNLSGIILRLDGSIWNLTHQFDFYPCDGTIDASGAHVDFLYGAMFAGATAEEAVRLAIKHCQCVGGEVQVERL